MILSDTQVAENRKRAEDNLGSEYRIEAAKELDYIETIMALRYREFEAIKLANLVLSGGVGPGAAIQQAKELIRLAQPQVVYLEPGPLLKIQVDNEGVWLLFSDKEGGQAALNLTLYAQQRGHIVGGVITNWCRERQFSAEPRVDHQ